MNQIDIEQCFLTTPYDEARLLRWFNTLANQLFSFQPQPLVHTFNSTAVALVDWKEHANGTTRTYLDPVVVTFDNLYGHILMSQPDEFTVVGFVEDIKVLRHHRKNTQNDVVRQRIKLFLNMIYGQLNTGLVRHATVTTHAVVAEGARLAGLLYWHPDAVYVDTDEVIFNAPVDQVRTFVEGVIDTNTYPVSFQEFSSIEINGKKRTVRYRK
jgi:hypothetical protein